MQINPTFLRLIAACLFAAITTGFYDFGNFAIDLFSHFQMVYLWVSVLLLIGASIVRDYLSIALASMSVGLSLSLIVPNLSLYSATAIVGSRTRLISMNVERENQSIPDVVREVLAQRADVALFYEVTPQADQQLGELKKEMPFTSSRPRNDYHGISLFSRLPLSDITYFEYGYSKIPSIMVTVEIGGKPVAILGTHTLAPMMQDYYKGRNLELEDLGAKIQVQMKKSPVIFAGDLNITPFSKNFRELLVRHDLKAVNYLSLTDWGTYPTWLPIFRIPIDHVLVSRGVNIVQIMRGRENSGSDHFPLWFDFSL